MVRLAVFDPEHDARAARAQHPAPAGAVDLPPFSGAVERRLLVQDRLGPPSQQPDVRAVIPLLAALLNVELEVPKRQVDVLLVQLLLDPFDQLVQQLVVRWVRDLID